MSGPFWRLVRGGCVAVGLTPPALVAAAPADPLLHSPALPGPHLLKDLVVQVQMLPASKKCAEWRIQGHECPTAAVLATKAHDCGS